MTQAPPANGSTRLDQCVERSPLITEHLSSHSVETLLAACRAAIANGEDVNAIETLLDVGHNEGCPLNACLRQTHMPGNKSVIENLPVIELPLEHGADPRLYSKSARAAAIPITLARRYSVEENETEEHRAFWKHLLCLFEEANIRIDAEK